MGNANSEVAGSAADHHSQQLQKSFDCLRDGNATFGLEQLQRLLSFLPPSRCTLMWPELFPGSAATREDLATALSRLEDLRREEDRLRFVLKLARTEELSSARTEVPYVEALVAWCAAVASVPPEAASELAAALVANFTPLEEGAMPSDAAFLRWANRTCPDLASDLTVALRESLARGQAVMPFLGPLSSELHKSALSVPRLWLLSCALPELFKHPMREEAGDVRDKFNLDKMGHVRKLFDTFEHGMSSNRFRSLIFGYDAPTLTVIEFREQTYCLALDVPFKEHWDAYGGPDTKLFSLRPKFCLLLSGEKLLYSNFTTKSGKRALAVGRAAIQAPILECGEGLTRGAVFGLAQEVQRLEVWGCGRDPEKLAEAQAQVRKFDQADAARQRNRKLRGEAWEDSPDRHLMAWGGVNAKHSEMLGQEEEKEAEETAE